MPDIKETKEIKKMKYVKIIFESDSESQNDDDEDSDEYKEINLADYVPKKTRESSVLLDLNSYREQGMEVISALLDDILRGDESLDFDKTNKTKKVSNPPNLSKYSTKIEGILFEKAKKDSGLASF